MIVVFGSINVDFVFSVDTLPQAGQTLLARAMRTEAGGKGANQAVAAAKDGATVFMFGSTGADALADLALGGLRAAGVDVGGVGQANTTGCATVCTDAAGRNQIVVAPGANLAARQAAATDALLRESTVVLTQMEADPGETAQLIKRARLAGVRPIHNLAPAGKLPPDALRALDMLVVNEDEAAWVGQQLGCEGNARELRTRLRISVIRTLGGAGVEWAEAGGGEGALPGVKVQVRDTTAAGDCFVGVLAAALDRGQPLASAAVRANVAAALACTRAGSQGSLPTGEEIDRALHGAS
ncbi:MAG: ribokinase [Acetobacteraceae bacterium]|nr:ribokinase [Acetobacteraceae bacterium]